MANWDSLDGNNGNGFRFEGSLDVNRKEPMLAYTFGDKNKGLLSYSAESLQALVYDSEQKSKAVNPKSKKKQYPLVIMIPQGGKLARWFSLLENPKHGFDKLRIHIYVNQNQSVEDTTLVFYNFKKVDKEDLNLFGLISLPATLFTFQYESMEVFGKRA